MDLTTLARAKQYLAGIPSFTGADALYAQMITAASGAACQFCSRTFQRTTYNVARLNGSGTERQALPNNPVISVSSLVIDGYTYLPSPDAIATGYQYDNKFLYLFGGPIFKMGLRNVAVGFTAGYSTMETDFIPAAGPYTITPVTGAGVDSQGYPSATAGPAMVDRGVTFVSNGAALTLVTGVPTAGQYAFAAGVYTFAAADSAKQVTMSYDYVPANVEQAVINMVGTWIKQRDNLGIASKSLANENISYRDQGLTAAAKQLLQPYRWVLMP